MKTASHEHAAGARSSKWTAWLYTATLAVMALTGFGQMPLYNRYYLSDVPGLGWLADFYVTRNIHYLGAAVLLALLCYAGVDFLLQRKRNLRLTRSGALRLALLAGVVISGALIVIKNFPHVYFSDAFVIGLNLSHLAMVMALLAANAVCMISKKRWAAAV
ncbi:MAG: hypothetical protein R6V84_09955 [Desulfobacterales bacterium]